MKEQFAVCFLIVALAVSAFALPSMPDCFRCIFRDGSGKTWRETGEFPLAPDDALAVLGKSMRAQGYSERFDIGGEKWDSEHILLWVKGDEEIIVSVWKKADKLTGCSWGLSVKTQMTTGDASSGTNKVQGAKEGKKK